MNDLPSGTVTFLFSDIEDSTRLLIELGRDAFVRCLAVHDDLLGRSIADAGGLVVKSDGGAFFAVFVTAPAAVAAVVEAQSLLQSHAWPEGLDVRVRMGLHTGTGKIGGDDYIGIDVHRASRIAKAAFGGQVLLSASTAAIVRPSLPAGVDMRDLGEHQLKDLEAELLFQLLIGELVTEFPPLQASSSNPTNLPVVSTSFVGRDAELVDIEALVRGARLVTLSGAAGAGKTRLALEVAAALRDDFSDGVWFIELSTVADGALVATAAAYALGIKERPGSTVRDTLLEHLASKKALLVIDNCEHVISAAAEFANDLLAAAPDCKVIATSREVLRVGGEVAYRLRSMSLPEDVSGLSSSEIGRYDAVRLFVERAAAVASDFTINSDNAAAIAEICRRLDGMPLAIELAAAQLRSSTPQQIADLLGERFQTLEGGLRTTVPRQQTLAAAIDWSYRLLETREQLVFERLSVFQGGFDLAAAESVCSGDGINTFELLNVVSALVDKSLVIADVGGVAARYRLLDMLRQFAGDRLEASGTSDAIQWRHMEYFVNVAEEAEPNLRGKREHEYRDRIDLEMDNFRLAMQRSLDVGEPEFGMRLAGAIWRFWKEAFRYSSGLRWLGAMHEAGTNVDKVVRAKVMLGLGTLMSYTDDPAGAGALLEGAIEIYRELDAQGVEPAALRHVYPSAVISLATNIWQHDQDFDRATDLWTEALDIARRAGDVAGASVALGNLAEAAARAGDVERARSGYAQSIEASRVLDSTHRTVEAISLSAVFEMSVEEPARAIALLDDAIAMARSDDLRFWDDFGLAMRAVATNDLGEPGALDHFAEHAARLFADAEFQSTFYYQLPIVLWRADLEYTAEHLDRAAVLLGVLDGLEDEHSPLEPIFEGTRRAGLVEALTAELGAEGLAAGRAKGKALSRRDAVNLTVGV